MGEGMRVPLSVTFEKGKESLAEPQRTQRWGEETKKSSDGFYGVSRCFASVTSVFSVVSIFSLGGTPCFAIASGTGPDYSRGSFRIA